MSETAVVVPTGIRASVSTRALRFAAIGTLSTLLYWALFLMMQPVITATWATLAALTVSTLINTSAQRRYTFDSADEQSSAKRDHVMSLAAFGGSWLLSLWALSLLESFAPGAGAISQLAVAQACTLAGSAARFSLLHAWHH